MFTITTTIIMFTTTITVYNIFFQAQEDAEVLRSLVIPLEEEIQALKEKLRYTDQQLRKYESDKVNKRSSK